MSRFGAHASSSDLLEMGGHQKQAKPNRREKSPLLNVKEAVIGSSRSIRPKRSPYKTTFSWQLGFHTRRRLVKLVVALFLALFLLSYVPFFSFVSNTTYMPIFQPSGLVSPNDAGRNYIHLYRIIGNDLPPRHKVGQTLSNLRFILEHEPQFPNTRKIFILNRIADAANEATLIQLLDEYNMKYLRIPFSEKAYQAIDFRLEAFPEPDFLHSDTYRRFSKVSKLRVLDYTYHDKNLYAMNNNGGRNAALRHGRSVSDVKWIMPFDGNCFLSAKGFEEIHSQLVRHGKSVKYFVVPMTRLLNNSVLLEHDVGRPKTPEEPQIIFRHDAVEEYNQNMRYGRRSKLELLWRLGALENRRLNRPTVPWEPTERPYSVDKGNFRTVGWVFRLFSGNPQQEENKKEASSIRAFSRLLAIQASLDGLDEKIARQSFRQDRPFVFDEQAMAQARYAYWGHNKAVTEMVDKLGREAEEIIRANDVLLAEEDVLANEAARKFIRETIDDLSTLSHKITVLTLANYFLGNEEAGRLAANMVRLHFLSEHVVESADQQWRLSHSSHLLDFLSDQGYSFPNFRQQSQQSPSSQDEPILPYQSSQWQSHYGSHLPILSASDMARTDSSSLLDCIRLLRKFQALTHKEYLDLQSTMAEFLDYLVSSPTGIHLAQMNDHRGALYDLQVMSLAAFTDDVRLFLRVASRCRMRIGKQFAKDGTQPLNSHYITPMAQQYSTMNLHYWTLLALGVQNSAVAKDIWRYEAKDGGQLAQAVVTHLKSMQGNPKLMPLAYMAQKAFRGSDMGWLGRHITSFGDQWDPHHPHTAGLPVYWMLHIAY